MGLSSINIAIIFNAPLLHTFQLTISQIKTHFMCFVPHIDGLQNANKSQNHINTNSNTNTTIYSSR